MPDNTHHKLSLICSSVDNEPDTAPTYFCANCLSDDIPAADVVWVNEEHYCAVCAPAIAKTSEENGKKGGRPKKPAPAS